MLYRDGKILKIVFFNKPFKLLTYLSDGYLKKRGGIYPEEGIAHSINPSTFSKPYKEQDSAQMQW